MGPRRQPVPGPRQARTGTCPAAGLRLGHRRVRRQGVMATPEYRGHRPATGPGNTGAPQRRAGLRPGRAVDVRHPDALRRHGVGPAPRRALRLGWRFDLGQRLNLSFEGERMESGYERADHSLMLRTALPWWTG